ncbi:MAG: Si-specific NAD(P)(+) transhydrogenase [Pseudomonadota bacterium]
MSVEKYDAFVVGSGPSGQKAAIQLAKGGKKVAVCEMLREVGGACVHHGTIPSKALRERAIERGKFSVRLQEFNLGELDRGISVAELIGEMSEVVAAHDRYMSAQLTRNNVDIIHGRASFIDTNTIEVLSNTGQKRQYIATNIIVAAGSKPRKPDEISVDHEHVFDSDSILTLAYLPQSLVVLGGGVIACEYASIFSMLGVKVTLIDRYPSPLGFLDHDLTASFVESFERRGGVFLGNVEVTRCEFDGVSQVETEFSDGTVIKSDKVLCALGRIADLSALQIHKAGLALNARQLVDVDETGATSVPHIYAVGDVVGPPSLASSSMEQGRRAACAILNRDLGNMGNLIPSGIYSIPELASVGLTEAQARMDYDGVVVGIAEFKEIARGHIANAQDGLLKLVVSGDGKIRGVHVIGVQATDLVHIGQMAMLQDADVSVFIDNIFNFPTYAESYRVAAISAAAKLGTEQESEISQTA